MIKVAKNCPFLVKWSEVRKLNLLILYIFWIFIGFSGKLPDPIHEIIGSISSQKLELSQYENDSMESISMLFWNCRAFSLAYTGREKVR